jgi:hypothetical protein
MKTHPVGIQLFHAHRRMDKSKVQWLFAILQTYLNPKKIVQTQIFRFFVCVLAPAPQTTKRRICSFVSSCVGIESGLAGL